MELEKLFQSDDILLGRTLDQEIENLIASMPMNFSSLMSSCTINSKVLFENDKGLVTIRMNTSLETSDKRLFVLGFTLYL